MGLGGQCVIRGRSEYSIGIFNAEFRYSLFIRKPEVSQMGVKVRNCPLGAILILLIHNVIVSIQNSFPMAVISASGNICIGAEFPNAGGYFNS